MLVRSAGAKERGYVGPYRIAVDQNYMTAEAELARASGEQGRFLELFAAGHERGGSDDSVFVRPNNGPVDARCEAKIISINDETAHAESVAGRLYTRSKRMRMMRGRVGG